MSESATCPRCKSPVPPDAPDGACPKCLLGAALADESRQAPPPTPPVPTAEEVEARLPGFEILSVLGQGGMGVVYKARQKALDRIVALKVLPPAVAAEPGFAERFVREAKAMARLQHPHIVAVHDFGDAGGLFWLSMEYVDGMNVREAMQSGRVTPRDALAIVPQICDALQYAHDRGVVHRDVKPENVLIDHEGRVKVADFGLAKIVGRGPGDASLTGAQQVMGTLHYMAPEQWRRPKDVDHRADIYSLGVVFYEMLTGDLPLGRFEPPSHKAQIDVRVDEVVLRSLERERERRWQHVSEMKTKVDEIASAPPPAAAVAAPLVASEPEDEGMKEAAKAWPDTFPNAAITFAVAVAFGVAAYFAEPALWWVAGTFGVGAVAQAITAAANRAKEQRPPAPVATARTSRLAVYSAIAVPLAIAGAFALSAKDPGHPWGDVVGVVVCGLLLSGWIAGVAAWVAIRRSRGAATGVGLARFAVVAPFAVAAVAAPLMWWNDARKLAEWDREHAPESDGRGARAPSDFEVTGSGTPQALEADKAGVWKQWSLLQGVHGSVPFEQLADMYTPEDWRTIGAMPESERTAAARDGRLGLPLAPREKLGAPLAAFRIGSVRFEGHPDPGQDHFAHALVVASDGERELLVPMVFGANAGRPGLSWQFASAPIEIR